MSERERDPAISRLYRRLPPEAPRAVLDREILAAARREARRRRMRRWTAPSLAAAAVLVLGLAITLRTLDDPAPPATVRMPAVAELERLDAGPAAADAHAPALAWSGPSEQRAAAPGATAEPPLVAPSGKQGMRAASSPPPGTLVTAARLGPWDAGTPLSTDAVARAFPGGEVLAQAPEGFLVLNEGEPALRLAGAVGEPARRVEAYLPAERWLPGLADRLEQAARARPRLACRAEGKAALCREPNRPYAVYRFAEGQAEALVWTNPD